MAEPIIVSYARGLLREFPGVPEGVVDVIPVDMVVAAIIAVAAAGPDPAGPTVYHVASSVRNPLRYGELVDLVRSWFTEHPLYDSDGQPIMVPEWSFPGRGPGAAPAAAGHQGARRPPSASSGALPVRGERADLAARVEERRSQAERALGYTELYGAYTETEAHFRVDRLLALWERLSPADQRGLLLRPRGDLVARLRPRRPPAVGGRTRPGAVLAAAVDHGQPLGPGPQPPSCRPIATWPPSTSRTRSWPPTWWSPTPGWPAGTCPSVSGSAFTARILREAPVAARPRPARPGRLPAQLLPPLRGRARRSCCATTPSEMFHHLLLAKSFPAGFARVRAHRALGHRTVLITGALDFVVEPLRPLFDEVVCAQLGDDADGTAHRAARPAPAHRRGAGPRAGRVRGGRGPRPRASRSPTPTRRRTSPCSSASGSRWR